MKFASLREALEDYLSEAEVSKVEDLTQAILDGHTIADLGDISFLSDCKQLGFLSMNKCDIKSLPEFPAGVQIERLELCDNKLRDGLEVLAGLENLEELHIGGNQITTMDQLKPLSKLKNLRILDLTDCPISTSNSELHTEIFKLIPTLEAFNGKDESGESVDFEDGSDDLDDYSDEDSEDDDEEDEDDDEDDEDDEDEEDDDEEEEGEDNEEEKAGDEARPSKSARHE